MLIKGKNTDFVHGEQRFHIQTECWSPAEDVMVSQIFQSGRLILKKKHTFSGSIHDLTEADIETAHHEAIEEFKELLI